MNQQKKIAFMPLSQRLNFFNFVMSEYHSKTLVMFFLLCGDSLLLVIPHIWLQSIVVWGIACIWFIKSYPTLLHRLTLLWYHTIVRPFFALDGSKVRAGVEAAHLLLQEAQQNYSQSALFLFFRGRVHRLQVGLSTNKIAEYLVALFFIVSQAKRKWKSRRKC